MENEIESKYLKIKNLRLSESLDPINILAPLVRLLEFRKQTAMAYFATKPETQEIVEQQIDMINENIKQLLGI